MNKLDLGFIILRCVKEEKFNIYWKLNILNIRKFYKENIILVIDDDSDKKIVDNFTFCDTNYEESFNYNVLYINSDYKARGEILPYYYFYKLNLFKKAIILHDSCFINNYINFDNYLDNKFLFHFTHHWDNDLIILYLIEKLNHSDSLKEYYIKKKWWGCFGAMSYINHDFITILQEKYNLFILLNYIDTREFRMAYERIIALLFTYENRDLEDNNKCSFFGLIHNYPNTFNYDINKFKDDLANNKLNHYYITKLWSGR